MPKLSERFVANFAPQPGAKDRLAFDTEAKGLGLRATANGNKGFIVQWTDPATKRKVREPLGAWGAITLEQARTAARARLGRLAAGFDPKAERAARAAEDAQRRKEAARLKADAAFTLEALIGEWETLHLASRRPRYAAEATRALRAGFKAHLARPVTSLNHDAVMAVSDAMVAEGKATTARLTVAYGRACFGWAIKRRRVMQNPFAGLPVVEGGGTSRERALNNSEVGEVWRASGKLAAPHGPMAQFALLTLARRQEVCGMVWGEVAADLSTWTQPGARTKNGKPHVVHLSAPARAVLRAMLGAEAGKPIPAIPPADRLVFGVADNRRMTAHSWLKRQLDGFIVAEREEVAGKGKAAPMPPWVLHDFRRSGVTWLAGAGFPPHVCDRLLNHVGGAISGVAAVYQKAEFLPERKAALDAWGKHILAMAEGGDAAAGNVVAGNFKPRRKAGG